MGLRDPIESPLLRLVEFYEFRFNIGRRFGKGLCV